ncbi:hypothetical protein ACFY0F_09960 [Streptomyces sp. NPDC001544]|uniref:hypothetical protein n=1 Tax=Streptomyces sp. NPDC001544 TaxID=3364584 RepID=UPI0036A93E7A
MSSAVLTGLPRTVLRLHRWALLAWTAFVVGMAGWLVWLNEVTAVDVRRAEHGCVRLGMCADPLASLAYSKPVGWIGALICYSFLAVAAFAGGSLVGREMESGTAELAWTQGVTPARWLTAKLAVPALAVVAGGAVLVSVYRWGWDANHDLTGDDWTLPAAFVARGPLMVAYGLCALAVGALAAVLLRRTLAALGTAFAVMWLLGFVLERHRTDLWPAVTRTAPKRPHWPSGAWQVDWGRNADGYFAVYQPESHYWPLHLVETGIVLTLAATATTAACTVLRRRTA